MNPVFAHTGVEPREWLVLFHTTSTPWVDFLVPGKFKHVSALGYVPATETWVSYSYECARTRISLVRGGEDFDRWFAAAAHDAAVLRVPSPPFNEARWRPRLGLTCVSAVKHLLGLRSGALLPDGLWRHLAASGAEIVQHEHLSSEGRSPRRDPDRESIARNVGA